MQAMLDERDENGGAKDDEAKSTKYNYAFFHVTFALAACYIAMMITSWGTITVASKSLSVNESMTSVWTRFISSWVCQLLYLWTLCAPAMCSDRDFS